MPFRKKRSFESLYPNANPLAIDFLTKTLTCESVPSRFLEGAGTPRQPAGPRADPAVDPKKRYTVEQCLEHPYLDAYHDPEDEPTAKPLPADFFDFDMQGDIRKEDLARREELKRLMYEEIANFHSPNA